MVQDVLEAVKSRSFPKISGEKSLEIIYSGEYMLGIVWHICNITQKYFVLLCYFVIFRKYSAAKTHHDHHNFIIYLLCHHTLVSFIL